MDRRSFQRLTENLHRKEHETSATIAEAGGLAVRKKLWRLEWRRDDGISTVLPGDEGIHRVGNPTEEPAISVHLYGPRLGEIDGRDYDPSENYVCDRPQDR